MRMLSLRGRQAWRFALFCLCGSAGVASADEQRRTADAVLAHVRLDDIKGQYAFPGGRLLTMFGSEYRVRAQLDGHPDMVMVRTGPSTFRAPDGSFTLTFRPHENGSVLIVDLDEAGGQAAAAR
jgi:hypothetical protein